MPDELDEFMELATAGSRKLDEDKVRRKGSSDNSLEQDEGADKAGKAVQWGLNGAGYCAVTKTFKILPPGVYRLRYVNDILTFLPQPVVTDNLLRLPDSRSDEVISEIARFWTLKEKFQKHGFTHKRGFLLWGPPGSGKTSTVDIVMNDIVATGGMVLIGNDMDPGNLASALEKLRSVEPDRQLVLVLEDIDAYIRKNDESQVLSILDGENSIGGCVVIATTNYPEELDGRIINRPSRFDRVVKIGTPSLAARLMYLKSRDTGLPDGELERWADETEGFSIAHLKELIIGIICLGGDLETELKRLRKMANVPKSSGAGGPMGFGAKED